MTCGTCGEKHRKCGNCNKGFPRAVIEINNPETLVLLRKVVIPASMGDDTTVPPAIGKYHNVILHYEANNHTYIYSSDGIPTLLEMDVPQQVWDSIDTLQQEIDDMKNSPDVVDIVDTYADLMTYDTSDLGDKDVIRVLNDETHDDESTYYRWSTTTQTWTYIGSTGPKSAQTQWTGTETNADDTGTVVNVTTTTGDFVWEEGNIVTVNFTHDTKSRNELNIDSTGDIPIDNVRSFSTGWDSGTALQYVCMTITGQRHYRPIGRLRASSTVAGPVFIVDDLTTTGTQLKALSANQGKVLNEKIGDLTALTTTDKTNTVAAINEVNSGIGQAKVLTEDDFNWNSTTRDDTEPYNAIALWKLPAGLYSTGDLVLSDRVIWLRNDALGYLTEGYTILVCNKDNQGYIPILDVLRDQSATGNYLISVTTVSTTGSIHAGYNLLDTRSIVDDLTSTSVKKPLSANQGQILGKRIRAMADSAPTTNTAGEPGNLMPVLLNGTAHLYMCTDASWIVDPDTQQGSWVYTWEQLV